MPAPPPTESDKHPTESVALTGAWEYDLVRGTMRWSTDLFRIHGWPPEDVTPEHIGRSMASFDPADRPLVQAAFEGCVVGGQACDLELPFTTAAGRRIWVRTTADPVWENGRVVRVIGHITDITERKRAEAALKQQMEALHRSEERFRTLVEQVPAVVYVAALDAAGTTLYVSPHIEALLGYTAEAWVADPHSADGTIKRHFR